MSRIIPHVLRKWARPGLVTQTQTRCGNNQFPGFNSDPNSLGALIIRIGFWGGPLRVPFKGVYKGSIVGFYSIGALIIRIGFWGPLYYTYNKVIKNPHNTY